MNTLAVRIQSTKLPYTTDYLYRVMVENLDTGQSVQYDSMVSKEKWTLEEVLETQESYRLALSEPNPALGRPVTTRVSHDRREWSNSR